MKRKILIIIYIFLFFVSINNVYADLTDYSGGTSAGVGSLGSGGWCDTCVGLKISIVDSNNELQDSEIFLNKVNFSSINFSSSNYPKTKQSTDIKWSTYTKDTLPTYAINVESMPDNWLSGGTKINMYDKLAKANYAWLKELLESKKTVKIGDETKEEDAFDALEPGDYIIVEPMTNIGGFYGTAFELSNSFLDLTKYSNDSFYWMYSNAVFGGDITLKDKVWGIHDSGLFFATIYLESNVDILELYKFQQTKQNNRDIINERNECFKSNTCGRGIGVFKYDDIYTGSIKLIKKDSKTNENIQGAGFTLYSDSSCSNQIKSEVLTDSSGFAYFYNLKSGTYYYKETTTPSGYQSNDSCDSIIVTNASQTEKTIKNTQSNGTIIVNKINSNNEYIEYADITFTIHTSSGCLDSSKYGDSHSCNTGSKNGTCNFTVPVGNYWIKETSISKSGSNYSASNECKSVGYVGSTSSVTVDYVNKTNCEIDFEADSSIANRIKLYQNDYSNYRNLLNFNITKASEACDNYTPTYNSENSCLYSLQATKNSKGEIIEFDENNISNYNEILKDASGTIIGYCLTSFKLENLIGSFDTVIAGQMVVKGGNIARTNLNQTCYILNGYNNKNMISNPKSYYEYITNVKFGNKILVPSKEISTRPNTFNLNKISGKNNLYEGSFSETYSLNNPVYTNILSGRICSDKIYECKYIGNGLFSNFQDAKTKKGNFSFEIEGDNKIFKFSNQVCEYNVEEEIITYPDPNGKLELEFRTIDTKNPFNDRTPNFNWSNPSDVQNEIIESVNSYGLDKNGIKQQPIYKITLTPTDIITIRKYNKQIPYDSYEVYCSMDTKTSKINCVNAFVYDLKNGSLNKYKINTNNISDVDYNIGILQNKLIKN